MKPYVRTIAAALVFVALAVYIFTSERGRVPDKKEVFGLRTEVAGSLKIERPDKRPVVLQKEGDSWYIQKPFSGLADHDKAVSRIEAITQLKPKGTREGVDLEKAQFGLTKPSLTATLAYSGDKSATVAFGKQTPVGSNRYAKIEDRDELYIVPQSAFDKLNKEPEDLREKHIADYKPKELKTFTVSYDDTTISLESSSAGQEEQWMLTKPVQARADEYNTEQFIRDLAKLKAKEFPTEDKARAKTGYGFDPGWLQVKLIPKEGEAKTVTFGDTYDSPGAEEKLIYARVSSRSEVMAVPYAKVKNMRRKPIEFRDRAVVDLKRKQINRVRVQSKKKLSFAIKRQQDGWYLESPQSGQPEASTAKDIIWDIVQLEAVDYVAQEPEDLKQYGLAVPRIVIDVHAADQAKPLTIKFGYQRDDGSYYCQTSKSPQVMAVDSMLIDDLPKKLENIRADSK